MRDFFRIKFTANNYGGRVGFPVFWFSSSDEPIKLPITQRSNDGNLFFSPFVIDSDLYELKCICVMTRAEILIKHNCTWFNINSLTNADGATQQKIDGKELTNAITNTWNIYSYPQTLNIERGDNILKTIENIEAAATREFVFNAFLYHTNDNSIAKDLLNNSFVLAIIPTNNSIPSNTALLMVSRSGAGNGVSSTDFVFKAIRVGKVMPKAFIHTNNSYANLYSSPSVCVTSMKMAIDSIADADLQDVVLPACVTGITNNSNRWETGFQSIVRAAPLVYVPMSQKDKLKVYTDLDFKGDLQVGRGNIASKGYADKKLDLAKLSLVDFGRLN